MTRTGPPLLVLKHSELGQKLRTLTNHQDMTQIVSLWSPVLFDGKRYTSVFYGIGQLNARYADNVLTHLQKLQDQAARLQFKYSEYYDLASKLH